MVSVTGILAFYQTKVPFHRKGKYPGQSRFLRRLLRRRQKARHPRDRAHESRPQLGGRRPGPPGVVPARRAGQRRCHHTRGSAAVPHLHVLHLHDRLHAGDHARRSTRSTTWMACSPTRGRRSASLPVCHCEQCRKLPHAGHASRTGTSSTSAPSICGSCTIPSPRRRSRRTSISRISAAASVRTADLVQLGEICEWFQCDNQGRGGDDTPIWGCALQGRVCNAVQKGKMATNVTGRLVHRRAPLAQRLQVAAGSSRCGSTRRSPPEWSRTTTSSAARTAWARTAAGWSRRASISTGWRSTTPTSSTSAPSPTSAW